MSTPKLHNNTLSLHLRPSHGAPAQEAVGPSSSPFPGPHLSPDARGLAPPDARSSKPRKTARGPAPFGGALLRAPDACGYLPQKKTRTPVPARRERSRRGRPYPQNRDGSGKAGIAEGSLPRLAPEGQGFEQEIILLRSMINRLLSRRPLNHTYISRYMRLLIQAIAAQSKASKELTDEQEVDSLIKKHFHKEVDDGKTSYYDLLPVRTAKPGDKWWPWRQLVSIDERRRDGLIDEEDSAMMDALDEAESSYYGDPDDDLYRTPYFLNNPEEDEDDSDPDDNPNPPYKDPSHEDNPDDDKHPPNLTPTPAPQSVIPDPDDENPPNLTVIPAEVADAPRRAGIHPSETTTHNLATHPAPSPVGVPLVGTQDAARADTGPSHDCPDPNPPPRIARGRPPP